MNILVTGGAGYLGSVLLPKLLVRGHKVRCLDIGYFGMGHLKGLRPAVEFIRDDIRRIMEDPGFREDLLKGIDCVLHLAAVSNDPSAELHPELTDQINFKSTVALAEAAKATGARFVFSSSCSVYGEADGKLTETGVVSPLTIYAVSKVRSEEALRELTDSTWRPVILRNGTLFGYSPRMRFDLVVNIFSLHSALYNQIQVFGGGEQWRPFLHVSDCAKAFIHFAEHTELEFDCYNVANQNLRVVDLAEIFRRLRPGLHVKYTQTDDLDKRDYSVSTKRMEEAGFEPQIDVALGAEEMLDSIVSDRIPDPESIFYRNAKWLKELDFADGRDHRRLVGLMESFSDVSPRRSH
jgi:nucleoside-diphosphate-sugar epimerase